MVKFNGFNLDIDPKSISFPKNTSNVLTLVNGFPVEVETLHQALYLVDPLISDIRIYSRKFSCTYNHYCNELNIRCNDYTIYYFKETVSGLFVLNKTSKAYDTVPITDSLILYNIGGYAIVNVITFTGYFLTQYRNGYKIAKVENGKIGVAKLIKEESSDISNLYGLLYIIHQMGVDMKSKEKQILDTLLEAMAEIYVNERLINLVTMHESSIMNILDNEGGGII